MLQFHLTRLFGTRWKTHGVAIASAEGLRLVFREGESPPKLFDKDIHSVLITWENFESLSVHRGFLGTTVAIVVRSASELKDAPGLEENQVELKIHSSNRDQIEPFERKIEQFQSGNVDEDVDEFVDDVRDMLEGH